MKVISNQNDLTSEDALNVFESNTDLIIFENKGIEIDISVSGIYKKFTGFGHYKLSVELQKNDGSYDSITLSRTTTNMSIVDEWVDETYFENEDSWFDSPNHLMKHVFDYVIENNTDEIIDWLKREK